MRNLIEQQLHMRNLIEQQLKQLSEAYNEARKETVIAETNLDACRAAENNLRGQLNAYQAVLSQVQAKEKEEEKENPPPPPSGAVVDMPKTEEEPPNES